MTGKIQQQQPPKYVLPIYPDNVHKSSLESITTSFRDTYGTIHQPEVIERLLTAFTSDLKVKELLKIYHTFPLKRWKKVEDWLRRENWRYLYAPNFVSMIILGIQHYCDELSAGWWN